MVGELRQGIAGQVQGELQGVVMGVGASIATAMAEDWKAQRRVALEGTPNRTAAEQMELGELQADDRKRLEGKAMAAEKGEGEPLTIDELSRLNGYEVNAVLDDDRAIPGVNSEQAGMDPEAVQSEVTRRGVASGLEAQDPLGALGALTHVDPEILKSVGDRVAIREATIRQLDAVKGLTAEQKDKLREMYDHGSHLVDVARRVKSETGSESAAWAAVAGEQMNREVWKPVGDVVAPVMEVAGHVPVVGDVLELTAEGMQWLEHQVAVKVGEITESDQLGKSLTATLTQGIVLSASTALKMGKGVLRSAKAGAQDVVNLASRVEVRFDPNVMGVRTRRRESQTKPSRGRH